MEPHFFVDRSLGRIQVPRLLRQDGWQLTTLAEHYGIPSDERVTDVEWLRLCGERGWPVLMKDDRIRYRSAEMGALVASGVTAFCLSSGNLSAADMAELLIRHRAAIWAAAADQGPSLYAVMRAGLRRLSNP